MRRSSFLTDTHDTIVCSKMQLFASRTQAFLEDVVHDGACGYRAVAKEVGESFELICDILYHFGVNNPDDKYAFAKKRWTRVHEQLQGSFTGLNRQDWLNGLEDCKLVNYFYYLFVIA